MAIASEYASMASWNLPALNAALPAALASSAVRVGAGSVSASGGAAAA